MAMHLMESLVLTTLLLYGAVVVAQAAGASSHNESGGKAHSMVVEACKNKTDDLLLNRVHFDEEPCVVVLHSDN